MEIGDEIGSNAHFYQNEFLNINICIQQQQLKTRIL